MIRAPAQSDHMTNKSGVHSVHARMPPSHSRTKTELNFANEDDLVSGLGKYSTGFIVIRLAERCERDKVILQS
jgi:hypothetical protein